MSRIVWWLFDHSPKRFQDWAESWARTLVVRRAPGYSEAIAWARKADRDLAAGRTVPLEDALDELDDPEPSP